MKSITTAAFSTLYALLSTLCLHAQVTLTPNPTNHSVDITIDHTPFTSYLYQTNQRKPVLYPLIAPDGTTVTRGFPFNKLDGERVDHPHHAGLWFNYGSANQHDYWNNSDAIKPADRPKYGVITQDKIVSTKSGATSGELITESTWTPEPTADTKPLDPILHQRTRYVFSKLTIDGKPARAIDLLVTLTALQPVTFNDDKEGLLGIRVAQFLESPNEKSGIYTDAQGKPTTVQGASPGATGVYRTSAGITGDAVWSTRAAWCTLTGTTADHKPETIAILSHPTNPNGDPYWHARGYGLFAVNPLGQHIFDPKAPALNFTLEKGKFATFRYRILILSAPASDEAMNQAEATFATAYK